MQIFAKKKKSGFTLIELLVVIAIIGILASIVLVSVAGARDRARTARIEAEMVQVRSAAEMSYVDTGNYNAVCVETGGTAGNSTLSTTGDFGRLRTSIMANNGGVDITCNEAGTAAVSTAYAAWSPIPSPAGHFFCVDSTGVAKRLTAEPAANSTVCP